MGFFDFVGDVVHTTLLPITAPIAAVSAGVTSIVAPVAHAAGQVPNNVVHVDPTNSTLA